MENKRRQRVMRRKNTNERRGDGWKTKCGNKRMRKVDYRRRVKRRVIKIE